MRQCMYGDVTHEVLKSHHLGVVQPCWMQWSDLTVKLHANDINLKSLANEHILDNYTFLHRITRIYKINSVFYSI